MSKLLETAAGRITYVLSFFGIIVVLFLIALFFERLAQKLRGEKGPVFTTRKMTAIGLFSALSSVLMLFEIPLPFAPPFYKLDFSEIPILIVSFAFGPAPGVMMEFIKILLKLLMKGTSTAFVGELANFTVGCSLIIPASVIYSFRKDKKTALIACVVGTLVLTVFGTAFNAIYLLPAFASLYKTPLEALIGMGSEVNALVKEGDIISFVVACVAPLNLIKGMSVSLVTLLIYKPLSHVLKGNNSGKRIS